MKIKKFVALFLLTVLLCTTFGGCKALDRAKESRICYTDKTQKEITYKNKAYKLLPESEDFSPILNYNGTHPISDSDMPIFISLLFSENSACVIRGEELIIEEGSLRAYARKDVYEKYADLFENHKLNRYVCWHDYYNTETGYYESEYRTIEEKDLTLIHEAEKTAAVVETPEEGFYGEGLELIITDESELFSRSGISMTNTGDKTYVTDRGVTYQIGEDYRLRINEIISKYQDNE